MGHEFLDEILASWPSAKFAMNMYFTVSMPFAQHLETAFPKAIQPE